MPQYIAGEKIKKGACVRVDEDGKTLRNLLKVKPTKEEKKTYIITTILGIAFITLYIYICYLFVK